jgi:deoxyribonuclease-4
VSSGCGAFQYFPKNPRSLQIKFFDRKDAKECAERTLKHHVPSIAHSPYPVNPAAAGEVSGMMAASVLNDLEIAEACGSLGVVVHFGVCKGGDLLAGYRRVIGWLNAVLSLWQGKARILLENMAGDHGPFGVTPEELAQIRNLCDYPEKIGFCLDTCHLFASGQWEPGAWRAFEERARAAGYWDALAAVHINDSMYPSGSGKDRHAAIGEGCIGRDNFADLLITPEIRRVPLILETPAGADGTHLRQIELVRKWSEEVQ